MTPLKAIKVKCLDCSCDSKKEVKLCWDKNCALYPFRQGKNTIISARLKASGKKYTGFLAKKPNLYDEMTNNTTGANYEENL